MGVLYVLKITFAIIIYIDIINFVEFIQTYCTKNLVLEYNTKILKING